jgi:hypothetical protein
MDINGTLLKRRKIVLTKLSNYGITNLNISRLQYLDFTYAGFQTPKDVGRRILILWAVSYLSYNLTQKDPIEKWLKDTGLWESVTKNERLFFQGGIAERKLEEFSWQIEATIVLSWAVGLLKKLPDLNSEISNQELDVLMEKLPIEQNPDLFLESLSYIDKEQIFIENITNEMITGHLRNLMLSGVKTKSKLNVFASFERHKALNWVRKFNDIADWDETDTST